MESEIICAICGGVTYVESEEGILRTLRCSSCEAEIPVRVHYVPEPFESGITLYKAYVDAGDAALVSKVQMKVRRVFKGYDSFDLVNFERQIDQGLTFWDLGFYGEEEVAELLLKAKTLRLEIDFVLS